MAISYPLTFPSSGPMEERINIFGGVAEAISTSPYTFESQIHNYDSAVWGFEITLPRILNREEAAEWQSFIASLYGKQGTFLYGPTLWANPRGSAASHTIRVKGALSAGAFEDITLDGITPSATGVFKKFDAFQLGNRLHVCLNDANANGSGEVTLDIFPPIRETVADNTLVTTTNPKGTFRLANSLLDLGSISGDKLHALKLSIEEAL